MSAISKGSLLNKNIRLTVIAGALSVIVFNLTNPFFSLFVIRMGGSDYHVAWLSALPALAAVLALIPGGAFVDRFTYKKKVTCLLLGGNRFFYLCLALVPFLPPLWQPTIFVLVVGVMRFPGSVGDIAWQSFFADYVPEDHRGRALAQKQTVSTIVGILITLTAGFILDTFPQGDLERVHFYQAFFILAFAVACLEFYTNMQIKEPSYDADEDQEATSVNTRPLIERFRLLFASFQETPQAKRFLTFAVCSIIFHFGWQMGWPLFSLYQVKHLHATELWISAISVVSGLTSALAYTYWRRFAEKHGTDITLVITGLGMSITPILYALSRTLPVLVGMNAVVGISTAGFILTLMNKTLMEAPKLQRTLYIASYNTLINVFAIFTPNIGVFISNNWGIRTALVAAAAFRFIGVVSFFIRYRHYAPKNKIVKST